MCDLNKVSNLLIAAKIAFIAIIVALGIAIINSSSLFAAAANIPLMVGVIAGAAVATGLYWAAVAELDLCAGTCDTEIKSLRDALMSMLVTMGIFTGVLIGLAVVAALPIAGAAAIGAVLAVFVGALSGVIGLMEIMTANAITSYNTCRAAAGNTTISPAVVAVAYIAAAVGIAFSLGGFLGGKIPLPKFSIG